MVAKGLELESLRFALRRGRLEWNRHALERMTERGVLREEVMEALVSGDPIEEYPEAYPLPSALFFGIIQGRPLHVVAAFDVESGMVSVVTVYEPDREHFEPDLKTRRKR